MFEVHRPANTKGNAPGNLFTSLCNVTMFLFAGPLYADSSCEHHKADQISCSKQTEVRDRNEVFICYSQCTYFLEEIKNTGLHHVFDVLSILSSRFPE